MKLSDLDHDINMEFLTKEEKEVLDLSWKGKQIVEISSRLHLSTRTVNRRIASIKNKIGGGYMTKKDYQMLQQGSINAIERIEKVGFEEFKKEVKRRGITKLPWCFTPEQHDYLLKELSRNLYNTMIPVFFQTLEDSFDFSVDDLKKLKTDFDKNVENIMDLDKFGEHYVSLQDFVTEMNEKYGFAFEYERVKYCQDLQDKDDKRFKKMSVETVIELLEKEGYPAAALFLKKKYK